VPTVIAVSTADVTVTLALPDTVPIDAVTVTDADQEATSISPSSSLDVKRLQRQGPDVEVKPRDGGGSNLAG